MEHSANSKVLFRSLADSITLDESKGEIESIVFTLLRVLKGISREDILAGKETSLAVSNFSDVIRRLNTHEPLQYILGRADFFGREFYVNPSVLIPRPETELIVTETFGLRKKNTSILDVGTGSGCIAVTLALEGPDSRVTGIDISEEALLVAKGNAERLGAKVHFMKHDLLGTTLLDGSWDVIVSNPPYVLKREASVMKKNVLEFEPHVALFVPDNDPLLFYKAIAKLGEGRLNDEGVILVEINEMLGAETAGVFSSRGYSTQIIKDLDGKDRLVKARKPT